MLDSRARMEWRDRVGRFRSETQEEAMEAYDKLLTAMLFSTWQGAADRYNRDPELPWRESEYNVAWAEWSDHAEQHGLCLQCAGSAPAGRAYCKKHDETAEETV